MINWILRATVSFFDVMITIMDKVLYIALWVMIAWGAYELAMLPDNLYLRCAIFTLSCILLNAYNHWVRDEFYKSDIFKKIQKR